ncbi:MAG: trypsin-like peptidase domain-containing protein [Anaerolineae bacterium]
MSAQGTGIGAGVLSSLSDDLVAVVAAAQESIVQVDARDRQTASGIVWSADGLIVTADHVVQREDNIKIGLPDGTSVQAQLVGRDPNSDLALLRVEGAALTPPTWGQVAEVGVGQLVLAVARPDDRPMATIGIVSAFAPTQTRRGQSIDVIQTDVTLYPGFSGGALVDARGQIIGLNSSHLARGISTAIGVGTLRRVVEALTTTGRVRRGYLGVGLQPVPLPAQMQGVLGREQASGLLVLGVEPGSPAETGGLLLGDIIVGVAGRPTPDMEELQGELSGERVGQATPLEIIRGGQQQTANVIVGERE